MRRGVQRSQSEACEEDASAQTLNRHYTVYKHSAGASKTLFGWSYAPQDNSHRKLLQRHARAEVSESTLTRSGSAAVGGKAAALALEDHVLRLHVHVHKPVCVQRLKRTNDLQCSPTAETKSTYRRLSLCLSLSLSLTLSLSLQSPCPSPCFLCTTIVRAPAISDHDS
jgi:hypothetical protein